MIEVTVPVNPLSRSYTYWFNNYDRLKLYDQSLECISTFDTIEKFWNTFNFLRHPDELNIHADCLIFKTGIKPIWEDKTNVNGGKWILRLKKGLSTNVWKALVLAMLEEKFDVGDEICGVVVSVRGQEDILSVWNKSRNNETVKKKIRETMFKVLNLPPNTVIEYKGHAASIKFFELLQHGYSKDQYRIVLEEFY